MSNHEVPLIDGFKLGDDVHMVAVIRRDLAVDMINAVEAAEKLISTPDGYQLVSNPLVVGFLALGQQIISVGDIDGPFGKERMGLFSGVDLEILRQFADGMNVASLKQIEARGRSDPSSE